ncbi:MAG: hydroxylamine reductase [Planctomycetia bacterium]|nr:hydroxylamine reductase [Planctomycetia bacterium]
MDMFCYQCQETLHNSGCVKMGVCGKTSECADLMDVLLHALRGLALAVKISGKPLESDDAQFIATALFATLTNTNFDLERIENLIVEASARRNVLTSENPDLFARCDEDVLQFTPSSRDAMIAKSESLRIEPTVDPERTSLREILTYGLKGLAAYAHHAAVLGFEDASVNDFFVKALCAPLEEHSIDEWVALVMECGKTAVAAMAILDKANTSRFGDPEPTVVANTVGDRPGILVSGHDLLDLEELLIQTQNEGIDIYTHGEMLPANAYPKLKKYAHLKGNYGGSWWKQPTEFELFHGPILMTTNCLTPPRASYRERIFTTGVTGFPGIKHIPNREAGKMKDFSEIIQLAKSCAPPAPASDEEPASLVVGFARATLEQSAPAVVEALKSGAIRRIIVMAGCDGRHTSREYFTEVAKKLPQDALILTAGCAKYRFNKLDLGEIGGIPRLLDAGQCNDSYALATIALKLREVLSVEEFPQLPIYLDLGWYEQKAVAVLLALFALGFQGMRLGPTLPAFVSGNILEFLVKNFGIAPTTSSDADVSAMCAN